MTNIEIASLRPWWLRLLLLGLIASPVLTHGRLHATIHAQHAFADLLQWVGYALFVWLFVSLCVGVDRLFRWLAVAAIFGFSLAFGGAFVDRIGVWDLLRNQVAALSPTATPSGATEHNFDLVYRLVMIMATLPYFLLVVNSFPAGDLFARALPLVRSKAARRVRLYVSLAVVLRMMQHVFELFTSLLVAWREENPIQILPRFKQDIHAPFPGYFTLIPWARASIWTWCQALLMHSLLFVPVVVSNWRDLSDTVSTQGDPK